MTTLTNGQRRTVTERPVSRREFLFYLGGASAALAAAGTCGAIYQFTQQRLVYGRDSGVFLLNADALPTQASAPVFYADGLFYLVLTTDGLIALNGRCVRDQYLIRWVDNNHRYECPACGSKFQLDGAYIEGPASRSADRFAVEVRTPDGIRAAPAGAPVSIEHAESITVDTRSPILGAIRATSTPYQLGGRR